MNKKTVIGWEIVMVMLVLAVYGGCFYFGMREHLALILASGVVFAVCVLTIPITRIIGDDATPDEKLDVYQPARRERHHLHRRHHHQPLHRLKRQPRTQKDLASYANHLS